MAPPPLSGTPGATEDFLWPEFDRWQAAFAAVDIFPARWEGLRCAPPARTPEAEAYQLRKRLLFDDWLDMLASRAAVLAHYARHGIRARVARQDARAPCPACDPFNGCEAGPGPDALPPFHPGCRCVLVASHAGPAERRGRSRERPRPRLR